MSPHLRPAHRRGGAVAGSSSSSSQQQALLVTMLEMGIPKAQAELALEETGGVGVEVATEWLFSLPPHVLSQHLAMRGLEQQQMQHAGTSRGAAASLGSPAFRGSQPAGAAKDEVRGALEPRRVPVTVSAAVTLLARMLGSRDVVRIRL